MKEPFKTCLAFIIVLNILSQLTHGSKHHDRDRIYPTNQSWKVSTTHSLMQDSLQEWGNKRDEHSRDTGSMVDQATLRLNNRVKVAQENVNETNKYHSKENSLPQAPDVDVIVQEPRRRNFLHKKYLDKVLRKRPKEKPRQEIEFLEDNQDAEAKQDEYGSPSYEDVTGDENSEGSDKNSFSNSYVTIIDNADGKTDTDPYSTLSSDVAKSEYTNVESSINEGANEESQLLGKEVNDVLGALTKSDSRINQVVAGERMPQVQSDRLLSKQTGTTANDGITILDNSKEEVNNTQSRLNYPPGDVTVIEDQEEVNESGNTRPVLSEPVWNAIQQVEKNFTNQSPNEEPVHRGEESQSGKDENGNHGLAYSVPLSHNVPQSNLNEHPSVHHSDLESTLNMFANSKNQSEKGGVKEKPENVQTKEDENKIFISGDAEEGPEIPSLNSQRNQTSPYVHRPENVSNSYSYNGNGFFTTKSAGDSSILLNSPGEGPFQMGKGNNPHIQPTLLGAHAEHHSGLVVSNGNLDKTGQKTNKYQRPGIGMSFPLTSSGSSSLVDISSEEGSVEVERPNSDMHLMQHAHNGNDGRQDEQQAQNDKPHFSQGTSSVPPNTPTKGIALFKAPIQVKPSDVRIIYVKPLHPGSLSKNRQENRTISFQNDVYYRKPKVPKVFESQSLQNNDNKTNVVQHTGSTLPWVQEKHVSAVNTPLTQEQGPFAHANNADNEIQHNNRQPGQGPGTVVANEGDKQASLNANLNLNERQKGSNRSPQQNDASSQRMYSDNQTLESWSAEYHNLIEKLRELYGRAHGNTSPEQVNDAERMMKEVSRFHALFVGRANAQKGTGNSGGNKGMLLKDVKGGSTWNKAGMTNTLNYLPYVSNRNDRSQNIFAMSPRISKDVPGQVRSIPEVNPTVVSTSNYSNLAGTVNNDTETLDGKANTTLLNQRLDSRLRSTDYVKVINSSETPSSSDGDPSSHQVLMTYFRNETNLRKQYYNNGVPINEFTVGELAEIKDKEDQAGNNTNGTKAESTKIGDRLSIGRGDASKNLPNDFVLPWPSQVKNVSKEEEEVSLAKYIEDFIAMLSPNKTMEPLRQNQTTEGSSNISVSNKANMERLSPSEVSKKENVTDLNNRVIIVVSPKSLKDLMENRTNNSSLLGATTDHPITAVKAENSTAKLKSNVNMTIFNFQGIPNSLSGNTTINHQGSIRQMSLNITNHTSSQETIAPESKEADLSLPYREELKSLEISLSRDFMNSWIYYQKSLDELGITPGMLRSGIANLGSPQRLKRIFKKALAGTDVNVLVVGGSISAGGGLEKDRGNVEGVYHKAFSDWWNNTVTPITTSQLKINTVAIGGTDSEYFSYCIKNYMRSLPDIVFWELAANDYQRYKGRNFAPAKPLEQLTRIILGLPSHPALIFANFFRGNYYRTALGQDCPDSEDEGGSTIAQYYKLTSLSWRNVICSSVIDKELDLKKLFSSDGYHPSLLGHAQMSTLLISYLKGVFEQTISQEMTLARNHSLLSRQQDEVLTTLPKPIFDDPMSPSPFCWTLLTPDYGKKLRNTLPDLEFTEATGFQFANISHWPVRRDRLRCLRAIQTGAMLKMKFIVPSHEDTEDLSPRLERELAITTHNSFGGMGTIWVDDDQQSAKIIKENGGQRRTQVDVLTRTLAPGVHTVTVSALQPGFCLSAVAVL